MPWHSADKLTFSNVPPQPATPPWGRSTVWRIVAAIEVALAIAAAVLDLFIPAVVLLMLCACSLVLRRQGLATLGVRRPPSGVPRMVGEVVLLTLGWNVLTVLVFLPLLELWTGTRRDVSAFATVQGDLPRLLLLLTLSWTLAAVGEEFAFRGYVQTRLREVLPGRLGLVLAILFSSILFGLVHSEQGVVGVLVTTADGVFFSILRYRFSTLWAAVLSHGTSNTVGIVAYYLFGPIQAPW